jgi:NADH:ubiquinone oxidoreductase subunit K
MFLYFELLLLMASLGCLISSFYYNDNTGFLIVISLLVLAACEASIGLILLILNSRSGLDMSENSQFKLKK